MSDSVPQSVPKLFRPCSSYERDLEMSTPESVPSCVHCREQYQENVCPVFRRRLLRAWDGLPMEMKMNA